MPAFVQFVFTPAGLADAALAVAGSRAGAVGVYNAELDAAPEPALKALESLARHARGRYGVKLDGPPGPLAAALPDFAARGLGWLILDAGQLDAWQRPVELLRALGVKVLAEVRHAPARCPALAHADGVLVKGNEAGGMVGEEASFILLQKWLAHGTLPVYLRGGLTPRVAAACAAVGVAGGVLDSQLLLLDEVRLPEPLRKLLGKLAGSETVAVGDGEQGDYFRLLVRPELVAARAFAREGEGDGAAELQARTQGRVDWHAGAEALLPIGQDVAFAAAWRQRYGHLGAVLDAIAAATEDPAAPVLVRPAIAEGAPLAKALGLRLPIVQGPMTRVSDTSGFAAAVAQAGALPMLALATLKGAALKAVLEGAAQALEGHHWGIGLLGFAPQALLDEQLAESARHKPDYAIIAGGRPDQAVHLERAGVPTFLHVPAASLIEPFLQEGARRFIFEGRECGGHIGPLSSFVLWSSMVERLEQALAPGKVQASELELLFAGGIHDARSSAMLQVLVAPLAAAGVKVGILMGSAYLFTREIVDTGAIVPRFQQEVLDCEHTVNLESGPGHASRCAYTPFAQDFFRQRVQMRAQGLAPEERRRVLDELILGRLRTASKGARRDGLNAPLRDVPAEQQHAEGMYMLGQAATLRQCVTDIPTLHAEVSTGAVELLAANRPQPEARPVASAPADVAIVGMAAVLPMADSVRSYWENILARVDAITEIPSHRWDWRLYFDADPQSKDRIYSKWGGFLDDLAFDPTSFGMPPKSIESVDPMQLMGLEVARRTLADAGYADRPFDRERASVLLGASGGTGDFGMQYGLRAEWPRFSGSLPPEVAARLPEWTEDSFAGILPNVAAGRIANRLDFGGMNMTTDAACASSLAAVYQGVGELVAGRSDFVIAGGIDTVQGPFGYLCFSKTQALSPRGRCATFDTGGDGIVISEGIVMVALKRLADAERDGDRIYAVIKGVGASSDGSAKGMTAPLPAGQLRAMRRSYQMAGFGASTVGLFEAHGTGTVAGDTAELESTMQLIAEEGAPARHAVIGSVKTNIGHTKATAGIAGMVKAALALHHRVLPPHRNVTNPLPVLADARSPLYIVDQATPWLAQPDRPRRASCSAFGFGGTNFHVAMEEHAGEYRDWLRPAAAEGWSAELLVWSAADPAQLHETVARLAQALDAGHEGLLLRDLAASLADRFEPAPERLAIVARSVADLRSKLAAVVAQAAGTSKPLPPGVFRGSVTAPAGPVAVLFSGQGSQYPGMAREAALHFDPVAQALAEADAVLQAPFEARFGPASRLSGFVWPRGAYGEEAQAEARRALMRTDVAQPALGAVEVGLYRLMHSLGLRPDMLAGHSYGELVALHAAGALDFGALMQLSAARGRFIVDAAAAEGAELGTMAAASASRKVVEDAIADLDDVLIANHNAPAQCIVSGSRQAVQAAKSRLHEAGVEVTDIPVAAAFHSSLVKPAQQALADMIEGMPWQPLQRPVYSNTTARPHAADVDRVKRQMAEHLVHPVEFLAQIEAMHDDGARVFVEIGPKSVLTRLTARILEGRPHVALAVDDGSGLPGLLGGLAQLLCAGVALDLKPLYARRDCRVGDPAAPAALRPRAAPSRHAWMLNGSGARRAGAPLRQVGVTLDEAAAMIAAPPVPTPLAPAAPEPQPHPAQLKRSRIVDHRRLPPGGAESSVMAEYFATMRQFLETQERVMSAYLGQPQAARPAMLPRAMPLAAPRMAELAAPTMHVPAPPPATQAPARTQPMASPTAAAPVPATPPAAKPAAPAPAPAPSAAAPSSREQLTETLLSIVEDKTGYPRDMLGLDQNLEADLGIDSIKRIEVVGALLQSLPAAQREALTASRSKLNTQATLNGMLDLVLQNTAQNTTEGKASVPFDLAGAGSSVGVANHPPRLVMQAEPEPIVPTMARRWTAGHYVLTADAPGVAEALADTLRGRGATVSLLAPAELADEASLSAACAALPEGALAGVLHLAPLGRPECTGRESVAAWRQAIAVNEKAFFLLVRACADRLGEGACVIAASDLGGRFGRDEQPSGRLRLAGGAVGAIKSMRRERPAWRLKAVDLDPGRSATEQAADLLGEMDLDGGRLEVGYPGGERTIFRPVAQDAVSDPARGAALRDLVVLATGGARGITAEVLRELAQPGNLLLLTGRSPMPGPEPEPTRALADAKALRAHFVAQVRAGALLLKPLDIERRVSALLAAREMRANVADFEASGAKVEYHAVDVTDEAGMADLLRDLRARHGRIDGVVHGAGVIEDKLLVDKTADSWSRVVDAKVIGLLLLQKHLDPATLKFFCVFSSVAGRFGNHGQIDYATANELMNRLCAALQGRWGRGTAVSALNWGPWGPTRFGAGMVTAQTEAKFAAMGVSLVSAELGRRLFRQALSPCVGSAVEVICGAGPWEAQEAGYGQMRLVAAAQDDAPAARPMLGLLSAPLLGSTTPQDLPTGERRLPLRLDPSRHLYLGDHVVDGRMLLPAAAVLELMAEGVHALWPGWTVAEVRALRLLEAVDVPQQGRALRLRLSAPPYGSSEGFDVHASLESDLGGGRTMEHGQAEIRLEQALRQAEPPSAEDRLRHDDKVLRPDEVYGRWLWQGPRLQVIEAVEGLSPAGASALVRSTAPGDWLDTPGPADWLFDPALLDAAAQLACLWAGTYRQQAALPAGFGSVVRYRTQISGRLRMDLRVLPNDEPVLVRAQVGLFDEQGALVLAIEDLDCVAAAAAGRRLAGAELSS